MRQVQTCYDILVAEGLFLEAFASFRILHNFFRTKSFCRPLWGGYCKVKPKEEMKAPVYGETKQGRLSKKSKKEKERTVLVGEKWSVRIFWDGWMNLRVLCRSIRGFCIYDTKEPIYRSKDSDNIFNDMYCSFFASFQRTGPKIFL